MQSGNIISLLIMRQVFAILHPLSKYLQSVNIDLKCALKMTTAVYDQLMNLRANADVNFNKIFQEAVTICEKLDIEMKAPRTARQQLYRSNPDVNSVEAYYRVTIYINFLDSVCTQLKERLLDNSNILSGFAVLLDLDSTLTEEKIGELRELAKIYNSDINVNEEELIEEFKLYKICTASRKGTAIEALKECNQQMFPNVARLLQMFATLPVSTATNERSFSTLARLKTYLRNTISQNRLNGLALLATSREIPVTEEEIIEIFAKENRRIELIL